MALSRQQRRAAIWARRADPPAPWVPYEARYWPYVDRSAGPRGCWPWTGRTNPAGFGYLNAYGKTHLVQRVAVMLYLRRPLPAGWRILRCPVDPRCCNPAHLAASRVGRPGRRSLADLAKLQNYG